MVINPPKISRLQYERNNASNKPSLSMHVKSIMILVVTLLLQNCPFSQSVKDAALPWQRTECGDDRAPWIPDVYQRNKGGQMNAGTKGFSMLQPAINYKKCGNVRRRSFVPFGQQNEDIKIWKRFFSGDDENRSSHRIFVEMGGLDGIQFSNTFIFEYCFGWKGILLEAHPDNFKQMVVNRPCVHTVWAAACDAGQGHIFMSGSEGVAEQVGINQNLSLTAGAQNMSNLKKVPCRPLGVIFDDYAISSIDFFSLDVEGAEVEVLRTIDFSAVRINVIIVEINKLVDDLDAVSMKRNLEVDRILKDQAGMIKLAVDGKLVPECQRKLKNLRVPELSLHGSSLYVHPSLRDDICPPPRAAVTAVTS
jgi:FkbM family methyltransferase